MHWLVLLTLLTTCFNEAVGAACSGNNCLRAVQKAPSGNRNGTADCISFFRTTITPTPIIVSTTTTVTTTLLSPAHRARGIPELGALHEMRHIYGPVHELQVLPGNTLRKRQTTVTPTSIPAWASPCSSVAAYSSACSCLGVPRSTITAAAQVSTSVYTVTETVSPLPTKVVDTSTSSSSTSSSSSSSSTSSTVSSSMSSTSTSSTVSSITSLTSTSAFPTLLPNSTAGIFPTGNGTTNTTSPTSTFTIDPTCGQTSSPFSLRLSAPSSPLDGWFAYLSGDGVLFTSSQKQATSFSVEGTGHLCAVGYEGEYGNAVIAVVTNLTEAGAVWMLDGRRARALSEDYVPVTCTVGGRGEGGGNGTVVGGGGGNGTAVRRRAGGGGLSCGAQGRGNWVGCGLQLDLSTQTATTVDGIDCTSIGLEVV